MVEYSLRYTSTHLLLGTNMKYTILPHMTPDIITEMFPSQASNLFERSLIQNRS